jgi:hypothetical protein
MWLSTSESSVSVDQRQVEPSGCGELTGGVCLLEPRWHGHGDARRWGMLAGATTA